MALSHFTVREQLGRFWPFFILLFVAILYLIYMDLSMSRMLSPGDTRKLQARIDGPAMAETSAKKSLPYPVMLALVHYATTAVTPLQTSEEIMITTNILSQKAPCNFLIFGLGHDSTLWQALNHGGNTVFLEDDPNWIAETERSNPDLKAIAVKYTTMVSGAAELLAYARREEEICSPAIELQKSECKLAMKGLPEEIYEKTWDVVMIDAPKGYFEEAPGRMSAIFSAAVMAKGRGKKESTHILVHNVDRAVEKEFSQAFLCSKNLIEGAGKLWHFQIYGDGVSRSSHFCSATSMWCFPYNSHTTINTCIVHQSYSENDVRMVCNIKEATKRLLTMSNNNRFCFKIVETCVKGLCRIDPRLLRWITKGT